MKKSLKEILRSGGVAVIPTDTIYGIVGSALNKKTIERIYTLRRRNPKKSCIILVSSITDLKLFHVKLGRDTRVFLKKYWPGKVSVILEQRAFRVPKLKWLQKLLKETGPLIAPSANWEGYPPAKTIKEAKKYFGTKVDFYLDKGKKDSLPSTLVQINKGKVNIRRQGAVKINIEQ